MHMHSWTRINQDSMPIEGNRVLLTDGETVVTAHYVLSDEHVNWFFDNPAFKDLDVQWWMELPTLPPRIKTHQNSAGIVE